MNAHLQQTTIKDGLVRLYRSGASAYPYYNLDEIIVDKENKFFSNLSKSSLDL